MSSSSGKCDRPRPARAGPPRATRPLPLTRGETDPGPHGRGVRHGLQAGFTLLELVAAMTLFAIIVIEVLADREKSLEISADARVIQTVRYLAAAKMDDILREPDEYDENDSGTFDDIDEEADWQNFEAYSWELTIREVVVVGDRGDSESDFLFNEDEDQEFPTGDDGAAFAPRMVREVELTVRFEPDGVFRPDLSLKIRTFIPPEEAEETQ